jgi:hypothetical protein
MQNVSLPFSSAFNGVNDLVIATIASTCQERQVMEPASPSSDKDNMPLLHCIASLLLLKKKKCHFFPVAKECIRVMHGPVSGPDCRILQTVMKTK